VAAGSPGSPGRRRKAAGTARGAAPASPETPRAGESAGFFPDLLRRGLALGFTGVFLTEEALRKALGDSVPRDMLEFLVEQTERTRSEFLDRLSREFGRAVSALDPAELARRLLEGRTIEVTARVRLVPEEKTSTQAGREDEGGG
jgi:hypothetical protein